MATRKTADLATAPTLSPVEVVALAKCVTDKQHAAARAALPENTAHEVDFTVRVCGTVQRAAGTPEVVSVVPATLSLARFEVFCHVLKNLGVGPARLRSALLSVATDELVAPLAQLPKFADVFAAVADELAAKLSPVTRTVPARSGNISAQMTVTKRPGGML